MAISTADFKNGMCIEYNNKLWTIAEFQHVKPGMTCYWQTRRNRDSITFDEWVDLDLWRPRRAVRLALLPTMSGLA